MRIFQSIVTIVIAGSLLSRSLQSAEPPEKTPAPTAEAQAQAGKLVKEIFGDEWAAATTTAQRQALAAKLLQNGRGTKNDAPGQYMLFRLAKDVAVQAADVDLAIEAVTELENEFQVDGWELKLEALNKIAAAATSVDQQKSLAVKIAALADAAAAGNQFPPARKLNELEIAAAKKSKDAALIKESTTRKTNIEKQAAAFEQVAAALKVLETTSTDAEANSTVGKYYCFDLGNWQKGLPLLTQGSDAQLKATAAAELAGPSAPADLVKLADQWWDYAEKAGVRKKLIQAHAAEFYRPALAKLTGITKDRVQQRLKDFPAKADPDLKQYSPDAVVEMFSLPKNKWKKDQNALVGEVGSIDKDTGKFYSQPMTAKDFEFGYTIRGKAYLMIGIEVDGIVYRYSRGHWHNSNAGVLDAKNQSKDQRLKGGTVETPDKWVPMVVKNNGDKVEFYWDGELAYTTALASTNDKHAIRLLFGSHDSTIGAKDFYTKLK